MVLAKNRCRVTVVMTASEIQDCFHARVVIYTFIINIARIEQTYFETNLHPFQNL